MSKKSDLIKEMLAMQKIFAEYEHTGKFNPKDYFAPGSGETLEGFRDKFADLANQVVDLAHEETGSSR